MKSNIYIDAFDIFYWKYWKQMEIYLILEFTVETVGIQWKYHLYSYLAIRKWNGNKYDFDIF